MQLTSRFSSTICRDFFNRPKEKLRSNVIRIYSDRLHQTNTLLMAIAYRKSMEQIKEKRCSSLSLSLLPIPRAGEIVFVAVFAGRLLLKMLVNHGAQKLEGRRAVVFAPNHAERDRRWLGK